MKAFRCLLAIVLAGVASVIAAQLFYKHVYRKYRYYTLPDRDSWK